MRIIITIIAVVVAFIASAEQYRLKFSATVDVLEGGQVAGQKRLKAGTVLNLAETALVRVKPTKFKDETDMCVIEEFELVSGD